MQMTIRKTPGVLAPPGTPLTGKTPGFTTSPPATPGGLAGLAPWQLLMLACGFDLNGNPPPAVVAAAPGPVRAAPGAVASDASDRPLLYETWWGYLPVVGSFNKMVWGRTGFEKVCGGAFFVLDCATVGPMVKGVWYGLSAAGTAGLKLAARGAGTVLQSNALKELGKVGLKTMVQETAEREILKQLAKGPVLLVGAETWRNHSVAYLIMPGGQIYKFHGGLTQLAKWEGKLLEKATIASTVARMNTMQLHRYTGTLLQSLEWWRKIAGTNALTSLWRGGIPKGCAGTQVLLLETFAKVGLIEGVPALASAARWLPLYLDKALGSYVLNPVRVWTGTALQGLMAGTAPILFRVTTGFLAGLGKPQSYQFEWSDFLPPEGFVPVASFYTLSGETVNSCLGSPVKSITVDVARFRDQVTDDYPPELLSVALPPPFVKLEPKPVTPLPPIPASGDDAIVGIWERRDGAVVYRLKATRHTDSRGVYYFLQATAPTVMSGNNYIAFESGGYGIRHDSQKKVSWRLRGNMILESVIGKVQYHRVG